MSIVVVRDLRARYTQSGPEILRGVSFTLAADDFCAVIGPSGAGKSTLIRCINRLVEPTAGQITVFGTDVLSLGAGELRRLRCRIGMIFQEFNLVNRLSVMDNVLSGRLGYTGTLRSLVRAFPRRDIERALAILDRVGLSDHVAKRADELSGGQRQRVGIATALALDPDLLILDEPTSALDVSVQAQIMNLLKDLKEDPGISMLFITHDIGLASDLCDRIAVTYAGEQMELGPAEQVLVTPHHPYSQLLLASLPRLHSDVPPRAMPGDPPDLTALPQGCRFHPRCPYAWDTCLEHPPLIPLPTGGHARCWLNDPVVAGERYQIQLRTAAAAID
jgi:phosphonate transport system ATP-binding protein